MSKQANFILAAAALLVDGAAMLIGFLFLADLTAWFQARHVLNVIALTAVYLFFCVAVYLIRKLATPASAAHTRLQPPGWLLRRGTMATLAVLFGLTLAVLLLNQLGYWDAIFIVDDRKLGAGESAAFFVYAPGAFMAAAFFYILVLSGQTRETILPGSGRYVLLALVGLVGVNSMMLLLTAVLHSLSLDWWIILPSLLLLFGPPRAWYLVKRPSVLPLFSFLLLILFYSWQITAS